MGFELVGSVVAVCLDARELRRASAMAWLNSATSAFALEVRYYCWSDWSRCEGRNSERPLWPGALDHDFLGLLRYLVYPPKAR